MTRPSSPPPTHLLRAFVAAARHVSLSSAAAQLHLSPPVLGRQLAELERRLGRALFERRGAAISLTAAGERYADRIEPLMQALDEATREVMAPPPPRLAWRASGMGSL